MTKNNLREHLTWFLRSHPSIPRLDYVSALEEDPCDIAVSPTRSAVPISTKPAVGVIPVSSVPEKVEAARTQCADNDNPNYLTDDMARLQFPPSSTNKPRMLSQAKSTQSDTSKPLLTPPTTRSSGDGSPSNRNFKSRYALAPNSRMRAQVEKKVSNMASLGDVLNRYNATLDIDEIDLTEKAEEHTSSSATVEVFGEPRRIWREDSASHSEPLSKKGKKRNSDEYGSDLPTPSSLGRAGKQGKFDNSAASSNTRASEQNRSINRVATFAARQDVGQKSPASRRKDPMPTSKRRRVSGSPEERHPVIETKTRKETRLSRSSNNSPIPQCHSAGCGAEKSVSENKPSATCSLTTPATQRRREVVEDSDGEDDEEDQIGGEYAQSPTQKQKNPATTEAVIVQSSSPVKPKSQPNQDQSSPDKLSNISPKRLAKQKCVPLLADLPTKSAALLTVATTQSDPRSSRPAQSLQLGRSLGVTSDSVQSFLDVPGPSIDALASQLRVERTRIHELKVAQMMEEDGVSAEVENQVRVTKRGLKGLDDLKILRASHRAKYIRKEEIKNRLLHLMDADLEDQESEEVNVLRSEVLGLNEELKKVTSDILECLDTADIWQRLCSYGAYDDTGAGTPLVNSEPNHQKVLIASTQIYRPTPEASEKQCVFRQDLHGQANDEQSPAPSIRKALRQSRHLSPAVEAFRAPELSAKVHQVSPSHAISRRVSNASPSLRGKQPGRHPANKTESPKIPVSAGDFPFEEFTDDASFSRRMRSPSLPFSVSEDFDHEGDEDDLLGAAEEAEQIHPAKPVGALRQSASRPVLQPITDNAQRKMDPRGGPPTSTQISGFQHPWSRAVKSALRDRFKLHGFRRNQLEAINATLAGKDTFVLMPTGGGKSLCYQLPAVVQSGRTRGVTLVISPLLSLMQDQVDALQKKGIGACLLNGEVTGEERRSLLQALRGPDVEEHIQILYVTPEMINKSGALLDVVHSLHQRNKLARLVIDEAHCVSQWGHDFRPDYKAIGDVRRQFSGVPVIALTATATETVKLDVIHNLGMRGCEIYAQSFNRPNLTYEIRRKLKGKGTMDDIANIIKSRYHRLSGIVYCISRKNCEKIAQQLSEEYAIKAEHYHAGMESQEKHAVQKRWQAGKCNVIVATIAFGMGIDKPDVRFVIHQSMPKSLEGYYQETGRAGRDGKRSECYLYYAYGDTNLLQHMIKKGDGTLEQKERQIHMVRKVVQFCENTSDCRRVQVLAYFNERFDREKCNGGCDNCNSGSVFESRDFTDYAESAINLVRRIQDRPVTLLYCMDVFRGSKSKKIIDLGHDRIDEHGAGNRLERGDAERLFHCLVNENALSEYNRLNKQGFANQFVRLGYNAGDFSSGRRRVNIRIRLSPSRKSQAQPKGVPKPRKLGTGVAAADDDHHPLSTNVSSPLQAATKRRLVRKVNMPRLHEESSEDEDELSSYEPVRERGALSRTRGRQLGPPITTDEKLLRLNETHRHVLEDFMGNAKKECNLIMLENGLQSQPFSNSVLREMAINFPLNKAAMMEIDGIDSDKVGRYGARFLKLVQEAHNNYEALMRAQEEDIPDDPNHRNVVEISDDEQQMEKEWEESDDYDFDNEETSEYFLALGEAASNAQMTRNPTLPSSEPNRQLSAKPIVSKQRNSSNDIRGSRAGRKSSTSTGTKWKGWSGTGGIKKRKKQVSGSRANNGSSNGGSSLASRKSGVGGRKGQGNGTSRSIGLMPT